MIAAEIQQFGEGRCYAGAEHFAERFGVSSRTIRRAFKSMKESKVLVCKGALKSVHILAKSGHKEDNLSTDNVSAIEDNVSCGADNMSGQTDNLSPKQEINIETNKKKRKKSSPSELGEDMPDFLRFWDAYPRHDDRKKTASAWRTLSPSSETVELILSHVAKKAATEDWQKLNGRFVPMATTYLHGKRWLDKGTSESAMAKSAAADVPEEIRRQFPGTLEQKHDPNFNPGPGWKLDTFTTQRVMPDDTLKTTTRYEWIRSEGSE